VDRAAQLEQEADAMERAGWHAFEAALGVAPPPPLPARSVLVARFKDVERWSHEGVLRATLGESGVQVASCPIVELGSVSIVSYGLQKSPANRPGTHARPYLRVANVQRGRLVLDEVKTINVPDSEMTSLRLEVGDILFVEGNGSRAELGRVALWNGEVADCVHQNHIIKARPQKDRLLSEFAMAWFNSEAGRNHFFKSGKTTSGLGTINSTVIRTAPIVCVRPSHLEAVA
jgi:type I restriction enzyme S subunit